MRDYFGNELQVGDKVIVVTRGEFLHSPHKYERGTIVRVLDKMADALVGDKVLRRGTLAIFKEIDGPKAKEE